MSNQLMNKTAALADILKRCRLTKQAADQEIEKKDLVGSQNGIGAEMTQEIRDGQYHVNADLASTADTRSTRAYEGEADIVSLNQNPENYLAQNGTDVKNIDVSGDSSPAPQELAKSASYRNQLASILAMSKQASAAPAIMTGTEVMQKIASLTNESSEAAFADAQASLVKLASTNPVFHIVKERIMLEKQAADLAELSANEGIPLDEAAAELDAAAEVNPEIGAELEQESAEDAVGELANVEQDAADIGGSAEQLAANASEALGTEVSPDDILGAAAEVCAQAEELGVEPEDLIGAAIQELQGGAEGGDAEPTEEDMANAQQILDAAAEQGISPDEVIQIAAGQLGGEGEGDAAPEEPVEKQASYRPQYTSKRAAYCAYARNC